MVAVDCQKMYNEEKIGGGGGQPDFSDFSDPDFGKINFHIGKIGKQFFANISLPDHFRAYVAS